MPEETTEKLKTKYKLKKFVKMLEDIKGHHTELVSVYVPVGYSLNEVSNQLRQEQSTSENIKSKNVRKNVTTSLDKIIRHLQLYKSTPENGLAVFCGNISPTDKVDIELFAIEPPEPIKVKLYWCDQRFVLDPLYEIVKEKEIYGIICLDRSEADIALLSGKRIDHLTHFESIVPGKMRAGGQSAARFARVREGLINDWLKRIGEACNKVFEEHKEVLGILLAGPGPLKEFFLKGDYLHADVKKKILGLVDTSYTAEQGLEEAIVRGESLLKEASVFKEKKLLQKFFNELPRPNSLVKYGLDDVLKALEMGAVDIVMISEFFANNRTLERKDIIEALEEKTKNYGTTLVVVSSDTREGSQFEPFGIAAFLRYNI
ncbi:MAG: peptide chain release factor aRF-1 [Candidatus Aenigmatarchaeota archaeon]